MRENNSIEKNDLTEGFDFRQINRELFSFLDRSPDSFWAVRNIAQILKDNRFTQLSESEHWELRPGSSCFVTRNGSSLIAFRLPETMDFAGYQMMASHCDSPVFKIKPEAQILVENRYVKLNVEKYGGVICAPWLDRPLSVAGRVLVQTEQGIETRLVNVEKDLLIIPNLAIHMNRQVNDGHPFNVQVDLLPLFGQAGGDREKKNRFARLIAEAAGVDSEQILDSDLYLYNRTKAAYIGADEEFIGSGRLDDLQCVFAGLKGFLNARPAKSAAVYCVFDNEEVGSLTKQGAAGTFLRDTLHRIHLLCHRGEEAFWRSLSSSFLISADNAHAVHPNYADKTDPTNRPYLNGGIVLKYSANQKYTTDAVSGAIFRAICRKAKVPVQTFANRSDLLGGSTLGNISQSQISVNTVDIGLPQLAMHSPYETAGALDTAYLAKAAKVFFCAATVCEGDGRYRVQFDETD